MNHAKSCYLQMLRDGVIGVPHWEDSTFRRFAWSKGYDPLGAKRVAHCEDLIVQASERLALESLPDARIYQWPTDAGAVVYDLTRERQRRSLA